MLRRGTLDPFYHLESAHIRDPRLAIERSRRLAAMLLDHSTAADPRGDLFVDEVACLDRDIADYEEVQRGGKDESHDGAEEGMRG